MTVTAASFRQMFNEFADPDVYSDGAINRQIAVALLKFDSCRWDTLLDYGTQLYTAHYLTLARKDQLTASVGGTPGLTSGPMASKSVDKVSASYDTHAVTLEGAGFWNMTRYGIELWQLMYQMGAGGMQVTGCIIDPWYQDSGVIFGPL